MVRRRIEGGGLLVRGYDPAAMLAFSQFRSLLVRRLAGVRSAVADSETALQLHRLPQQALCFPK